MNLYGLRDRLGNEYKLHVKGHGDKGEWETFAIPIDPKPEFLELLIKGQWYIAECGDNSCDYIIRFDKEIGDGRAGKYLSFEFDILNTDRPRFVQGGAFTKISRPATPQEIENHLRKICDEKYVGKRVIDVPRNPCGGFITGVVISKPHKYPYNAKDDEFWMLYVDEYGKESGTCVYCNGIFAEVAPLKSPKELPKTIEELGNLLNKYAYDKEGNRWEFLREQGYKVD